MSINNPPPLAPLPPLSAYIHWPFCTSICPYCDFNVHLAKEINIPRWMSAYESAIAYQANLTPPRPIETIFFGGGTPSLMPPELISHIIAAFERHFGLSAGVEISLEANPTSVSRAGLQALKAAGVTRVSLGVQSLDDAALKFLGRTHRAAEAIQAFEDILAVFDTASFDLIYARPNQTVTAWAAELKQALALAPPHLSAYQLTLEPATPFYRLYKAGKLVPPDEDVQVALFETTRDLCAGAGLGQYEISNFARAGYTCRHNLASWRGADYLGIGPGAHGRLTDGDALSSDALDAHGRLTDADFSRRAIMGVKNPQSWLAQVEAQQQGGLEINEPMDNINCRDEAVLFGLRLTEGISFKRLAQIGFTPDEEKIIFLQREGLLRRDPNILAATAKGQLVLDALSTSLLT